MAARLPSLPSFAQLSERVWRVLGLNPGNFTLQGTNTYLVGTGPRKLLMDCGQGIPEYIPHLQDALRKISPDAFISDIIITHAHQDHYGGLHGILTSEMLNPKQKPIQVHKFPGGHDLVLNQGQIPLVPPNLKVAPLHDGQVIQCDAATLRAIHTPGHTKDHCTFFLEEEGSLFTADCVLGTGSTVFEDLAEYLDGLRRILALAPKRLYPGHGPVIEDGVAKITEYIKHREQREQQIISILKSVPTKPWTALDITNAVYTNLPEKLHLAAARGIIQHMIKLEGEARAKLVGGSSTSNNLLDLVNQPWLWVDDGLK